MCFCGFPAGAVDDGVEGYSGAVYVLLRQADLCQQEVSIRAQRRHLRLLFDNALEQAGGFAEAKAEAVQQKQGGMIAEAL